MPFFRAILVAFAAVVAGCSRTHITVTNQSGSTISNLVISGSCDERRGETLATLSEWKCVTPYWGDAPIQLSFDSAGKTYITNTVGHVKYLGPLLEQYVIYFTVDSNMLVTSQVRH